MTLTLADQERLARVKSRSSALAEIVGLGSLLASGRVDATAAGRAVVLELLRLLDGPLERLWLEIGSDPTVLSLLQRHPARGAPATDLPHRLRDARLRAGLSARALDKAAGLKPGHVARIERGSDVQLSTATALAEALGVRVDWLATGSLPERWELATVVDLAEWRNRDKIGGLDGLD